MTEERSMRCPKCQHQIPTHQGFPSWCEQCEWNLLPHSTTQPKTRFERFKAVLDERLSQSLFQAVKNQAVLRSSWTPTRVLTLLLALLIHVSTLGLLMLGGWGVYLWFTGKIFFVVGIACVFLIGLAMAVAPRFPPLPERGILTPQAAPKLHELVAQIARELGFQKKPILVIDGGFNAYFGRLGWQQRPVVALGLPLFSILEPQEQVALIAHELAHGVNGDSARGYVVWSTVYTLHRWQSIFDPDFDFGEEGFAYIMRLVFYPITWLFQRFLGLLMYGLATLSWRDTQRAEYLADVLAARVAGLAGKKGLLKKLHYAPTFDEVLQRCAIEGNKTGVLSALQNAIEQVPARELERIARVLQKTQARLDTTHPPTAFRLGLLEARADANPQVRLSVEQAKQIALELTPLHANISKEAMSQRRDAMYAG